MNRRDAIRRTTLILGGTLSGSAILGVMSGCQADPTLTWENQFLTVEEGSLIETIVDHIIPRTDTPGAVDAGVPSFIDQMLSGFYLEKDQTELRAALQKIDADAKAAHGKKFTSLSAEEQIGLLEKYDEEAFGKNADNDHFFRKIKELTVLGFCTSEAGATEFLEYDALPGDYKGCIPYADVGKAWAT